MNYRKLKADGLFDGHRFLPGDQVLVLNNLNFIEDIIDESDAGEGIETFKGILSPGFINAHCHLELSHMKGLIPSGTGLVDFVFKVVTERNLQDDISIAIENWEDEMYHSGIIAVGDICNNLSTLEQKRKGKLTYYNFIESSGWLPTAAQVRFERSKDIYEQFNEFFTTTSIVPHAPYSVSDPLWNLISPYFENKVVSIHNQETISEDEFFMYGTGDFERMYDLMKIDNSFFKAGKMSSLQTYFQKLSAAASVLLVHNTFITKADIDFLKRIKSDQLITFCICINANLYIENSVPPLQMMIDSDLNIVLGTDSLASNHSLNLLAEMKTIKKYFPGISLEQMLGWVTTNAARALNLPGIGSFSKGNKPGVVLLENLDGLELNDQTSSKRLI